jgi:hypothetical protein
MFSLFILLLSSFLFFSLLFSLCSFSHLVQVRSFLPSSFSSNVLAVALPSLASLALAVLLVAPLDLLLANTARTNQPNGSLCCFVFVCLLSFVIL